MTKRLSLRADGCEDIVFFCRHTDVARRLAHAFSNMPLDLYTFLTADAQGTSTHPRPGHIVQTLIYAVNEHENASLRRRYGREHDGVITVFPTRTHKRQILTVAVTGSGIKASDVTLVVSAAVESAEIIMGENSLEIFRNIVHGDRYATHQTLAQTLFPDDIDAAIDDGTLLAEPIIPTRERSIDLS
jgi:hypothetical protein